MLLYKTLQYSKPYFVNINIFFLLTVVKNVTQADVNFYIVEKLVSTYIKYTKSTVTAFESKKNFRF